MGRVTDCLDYDDGANAVDALMTLHGDRPSGGESDGSSPAPVSATGTNKRAATSPKVDSLQAVKRAKNGSDSPATRTVIEVLNTPSVDSPAARNESSNTGEGYFKGDVPPAPATSNADQAATAEEKPKDAPAESAAAAPSSEAIPSSEPTKETEAKVATPPMAPVAAPAAQSEDVVMSEPEQPAPEAPAPVVEPTPAAVRTENVEKVEAEAAAPPLAEPAAPEPSVEVPIVPDASGSKTKEMEVDPPAEVQRPATPDLPPPPPPAPASEAAPPAAVTAASESAAVAATAEPATESSQEKKEE